MSTTTRAGQYQDTRIDVKLVLSALWIAMLIVFAYVDIFGFFRADILEAALDGKVAAMGIMIDQMFLVSTTVYILIPTLMVVLSLVLRPRVNRILNIVVALFYVLSIIASCIGEGSVYYLLGSAVEVVLLVAIVRTARTWPRTRVILETRTGERGRRYRGREELLAWLSRLSPSKRSRSPGDDDDRVPRGGDAGNPRGGTRRAVGR